MTELVLVLVYQTFQYSRRQFRILVDIYFRVHTLHFRHGSIRFQRVDEQRCHLICRQTDKLKLVVRQIVKPQAGPTSNAQHMVVNEPELVAFGTLCPSVTI